MAQKSNNNQHNPSSRLEDIYVRTMNSDIKSMQDQGGNAPKPYTPSTPPQPVGGPIGNVPPKIPSGDSPFQPPQVPPTEPPIPPIGGAPQPPQNVVGGDVPKKKSNKKLFITLLVALIVIAIAIAAYFFVIPLFSSDGETTDTTIPPETGQLAEPADTIDVPIVPEADVLDEDTTAQDEGSEGDVAGGIPAEFHVSLFSPQADTTAFLEPSSMNLADIKSVFSLSPTDVPLFREVVFRNSDGTMIPFEELAPVLLPSVFTETLAPLFESDATYFTYTDSDNTWFGTVARLRSDADQADAEAAVTELESNISEVTSLYSIDPGTPGDWKDGRAGDIDSRYIGFSAEGASFNYGWSGDVLLFSTSYASFTEAESRL